MNQPELEPSTPPTLSKYSDYLTIGPRGKSKRKAMNRNWSNQGKSCS